MCIGITVERGMFMNREEVRRYERSKPSLFLKGRIGRSIIETIRNTPKPDDTQLKKEVEELMERIRKAKQNGTF